MLEKNNRCTTDGSRQRAIRQPALTGDYCAKALPCVPAEAPTETEPKSAQPTLVDETLVEDLEPQGFELVFVEDDTLATATGFKPHAWPQAAPFPPELAFTP